MALQKKSLELLKQVQQVIQSYDFALTLRQIYYQLVAKQIIPNQQKYYKTISRLCVIGRDENMLPEDSFADRLREIDKPTSWDDLGDFMKTVKGAYKKSKWNNQAAYVETWTEKDALRGVISPITYEYDVPLLVVRGQVSRTAIYESYKRFEQKAKEEKDCYLFYFGDFDPSGISIYKSLADRIRNFGDYGELIKFERIALTREQIETYGLPQDPAKTSDPNYSKFVSEHGDNVVELDALPPDVLRELIEESIESSIDNVLLSQVQETEKEEKTRLHHLIGQIVT
jgi:hypothetical protein